MYKVHFNVWKVIYNYTGSLNSCFEIMLCFCNTPFYSKETQEGLLLAPGFLTASVEKCQLVTFHLAQTKHALSSLGKLVTFTCTRAMLGLIDL